MAETLLIFSAAIFFIGLIIAVRKKTHGFLSLMFFTYHLNYFAIPGIFHVKSNAFPFYGTAYSRDLQLEGALIVLLFAIFSFTGMIAVDLSKNKTPISATADHFPRFHANEIRLYVAFAVSFIYLVYVINVIGIDNLVVRRLDFDRSAFGEQATIRELYLLSSRSVSFTCLLFSLLFWRTFSLRLVAIGISSISLSLFFIINFPPALPRFVLASYLIVVICLLFRANTRNKFFFYGLFGLGVTTLFPYFSYLGRGEGEFSIDMFTYYRESGDFDGFQSVLNILQYVKDHGYHYGYQLLGALMAWVPRALWSTKPEPTGSIGAMNSGYEFLNISSPISAELYIDFGYAGVTFIAVFVGYYIRKIDRKVHNGWNTSSMTLNRKLAIAVFSSFFMILLRGPLIGAANVLYVEIFIVLLMATFVRGRIEQSTPISKTDKTRFR